MDKYIKAENTQKKYICQRISQSTNPLFLGRLILDMEEDILSLKLGDFIPKTKIFYS